MKNFKLTFILTLFFIAQSAVAENLILKSGPSQVKLIELFSSEGCSSCPPADRWLSALRQDPALWKNFVPLEFHVDYWNHLGWVDRHAKSSFTQRQRLYAQSWKSDHVYTPGFVLDGREWESPSTADLLKSSPRVGELEATETSSGRYRVRFHALEPHEKVVLNGAILGNGLVSQVAAGENRGSTLKHDFVVLSLANQPMKKEGKSFVADIALKPSLDGIAASQSIAFWVTADEKIFPIQAVGGDRMK